MQARFSKALVRSVLAFALLHYLLLIAIAGLLFLASHVPPKAANLDSVILALFAAESVLTAPRKVFLALWPGETTPAFLSFASTLVNSLLWGSAMAALNWLWQKLRHG